MQTEWWLDALHATPVRRGDQASAPSWHKECASDTTSASVVDLDNVWRLLHQANGKCELGPLRTKNPAEVNFAPRQCRHPHTEQDEDLAVDR